jgi:hypothetical protein
MYMNNLITRAGWEIRAAQYDAEHNRPIDLLTLLREKAVEFVDYVLFIDEAPFAGAIQSTARVSGKVFSGFAVKFATQGPHDRHGRSLRDLDLKRRLLRYPCSYMIYSQAFEALPVAAKDAIYERMWQVL